MQTASLALFFKELNRSKARVRNISTIQYNNTKHTNNTQVVTDIQFIQERSKVPISRNREQETRQQNNNNNNNLVRSTALTLITSLVVILLFEALMLTVNTIVVLKPSRQIVLVYFFYHIVYRISFFSNFFGYLARNTFFRTELIAFVKSLGG